MAREAGWAGRRVRGREAAELSFHRCSTWQSSCLSLTFFTYQRRKLVS